MCVLPEFWPDIIGIRHAHPIETSLLTGFNNVPHSLEGWDLLNTSPLIATDTHLKVAPDNTSIS